MYPPNADDIVSNTEWFHIGVTWRKSDRRAQIYLNARLVAEDFTPEVRPYRFKQTFSKYFTYAILHLNS
jgi:hypothetical protein